MVKETTRAVAIRPVKSNGGRLVNGTPGKTIDSFVNMMHGLGIGADNPLSTASYGFNPITRNRIQLEWMHRGSWLAGLAVDITLRTCPFESTALADPDTVTPSKFTCPLPPPS